MSNHSIIEHKANYYYVRVEEDYLALCEQCTYKKPETGKSKNKASVYCKAFILAILEHWTNDKRGKGADNLFVYMTYKQWSDEMYGMFGRNVIIDSLEELIGEGFLSRVPYKMLGRDTFQYLLNYKLINARMKALPEKSPHDTRLQVNAFTSKPVDSLQVNATDLQVNVDPFTSNHNIDTTYTHLESVHTHTVASSHEECNAPVEVSEEDAQTDERLSNLHIVTPTGISDGVVDVATGNAEDTPVQHTAAPVDAPKTSTRSRGSQGTSEEKKQRADSLTARVNAVFDFLDRMARTFGDDPEFTWTRSARARKHVKELLEGRTVTEKKLGEVYEFMATMEPDARTGFTWADKITVKAICENYDSICLRLKVKASGTNILPFSKIQQPQPPTYQRMPSKDELRKSKIGV